MIDTHAHIIKEFYPNIEDIIKECKVNNLKKIINCSDDYNTSLEVIENSKQYENYIFSAIGIHPENVDNYDLSILNKLENLLIENNIVAIGEIGLDYHYNTNNKEKQKNFFSEQLKLANKYNLPVLVHSRDAIQDCYDILKENKSKGIIHCFTGSLEMAREFIKLGMYLGIGGVLTFKNSNLFKVIEEIDIEHIVLETDSPFLSPEPYRGKMNKPYYVSYVAKKISEIKKISFERVIDITTKNANSIFDLK